MISLIVGSARSGSIGPRPRISATVASKSFCRSGAGQDNAFLFQDGIEEVFDQALYLGGLAQVQLRVQF